MQVSRQLLWGAERQDAGFATRLCQSLGFWIDKEVTRRKFKVVASFFVRCAADAAQRPGQCPQLLWHHAANRLLAKDVIQDDYI
jgi:hypothetical protein